METTHLETHFAFTKDQGSLERATERCVGVGACRNTKGGVMCPSYRATGEEQHSTRGRARLLWEMLAGALRDEGFQSEAVHQALDLCLSCKACKTECPVQVDMTAYKSEYLAQRYKGRLHPLHHYVFGFADKLARLGSLTPALTNMVLTGPLTSPLIKHIVRVAQPRQLPRSRPRVTRSRKPRCQSVHPDSVSGASQSERVSGVEGPAFQEASTSTALGAPGLAETWEAQPRARSAVSPTAGGLVARYVEQLLPPAIAPRRRTAPHRSRLQRANADRTHLLWSRTL